MGRRLGSYKDMTKGGGGAAFLDAWKEHGFIAVWLHREPPWERIIHNMRRVHKEETKGGMKAAIKWYPYTCWEDDSYHASRRFDDNPQHAQTCPVDRFMEWLEAREDLPSDEAIFQFVAGREDRKLLKDDILGWNKDGGGWKDDATGKTEFVLAVIPNDDPTEVKLTNEKWSLGQSLIKRIQVDCEQLGEDKGDPQRTPICYNFEYDKANQTYAVTRFAEAELTPEIQALWDAPSPDAGPYVRGGDPKVLREVMEEQCLLDDAPWDDIFGPATAKWDARKKTEDDDATSFDPEKIEADAAAEDDAKKAKAEAAKKKKAEASAKKKADAAVAKKAKAEAKKNGAADGSKPTRPTRPTKKAEAEPDVMVFECGVCKGDWPENLPKCPNCGAEAADPAPGNEAPGPEDVQF